MAGDFFLVARGAENSTLVVVGDVVGHGLAAARRASFVRATIALFAEYADDPMTILRLANTALAERDPGTEFVTALCASFAPDRGTVTWASAGHPPPWDLDRGVPLASVRHCPPLGIEPTLEGTSVTTALRARRGRPALHRRPARGAHRARGASATTSSASRPRATRWSRCRARRRPTSWPACARRRCDHAEGRPADDLCLVAVRLGAGDAAAQGQAA